jgi:hypothetical protein
LSRKIQGGRIVGVWPRSRFAVTSWRVRISTLCLLNQIVYLTEMLVFPKTVSESVIRHHLRYYSGALFPFYAEYMPFITTDFKILMPGNLYLCPLCLEKYFTEQPEGFQGNAEFSIDHVPPDSVGGLDEVITCKKCNNDFGTAEAELSKLLNIGTVPDPKHGSIFPYAIVTDPETGHKFRVAVSIKDGKQDIRFRPHEKANNPKLIELLERIKNGTVPKLKIGVGGIDYNKVSKALLKSAYLTCFLYWGYPFAYSEQGKFIRQVLKGDKKYPSTVPITWIETKEKNYQKSVSVLIKDQQKVCFAVELKCQTDQVECVATILIPSPTEDWVMRLEEMEMFNKNTVATSLTAMIIPRLVGNNSYQMAWDMLEIKD